MAQLIIEAGRAESQYWRDLWRFRELFYVLAWRDIMVRYKQTAIGVLWAVLKPLINTAIMVFVFKSIGHMKSAGSAPYVLMVFAAQMPWQFFSDSLSGASQSVVGNASLISKIYFPRLIIPAGAVVTALVDFAITFVILVVLMAWFEFWPTWRLLLLPGFIALAFLTALGPGLFLTALNVKYRDFRFVIPVILQVGQLLSPVGYQSSAVPEKLRLLYSLNPMVGVIDGFRWAILGGESRIYLPGFLLSLGITLAMMWLGIWYFRRMERSFADVI